MYDKDYLEYDEYGLKEVRCMRCNIPIKKRDTIPHKLPSGEIIGVLAIKTLSHFVPVPYELSDGSFANILMCKDCAKEHVGTDIERIGMQEQFRSGFALEAAGKKRSKEEIDHIKEKYKNMKVVRPHDFKTGGKK